MIERIPSVRVLLLFFGFLARSVEDEFEPLQHQIRSARLATTYHSYLAYTMIYALAALVATLGLLTGLSVVYFRSGVLEGSNPFVLVVGFGFPSAVVGYTVYRTRLRYPTYLAGERAREVELSMPNITNFLLALSRAGVPTSKVLRVIGTHADVLGEAANELRFAWRDMEYFGADVVESLERLSHTTPHDGLSDFIDGYLRALTGQGDVNQYLDDAMGDLFDKAELEQENFLATLGVLAEVYVAVFVALPIFALIILIVMGFVGAPNVLTGIRIVAYAVVPLTAIGFLALLELYMSNPLAGGGEHRELETTNLYDLSLADIPVADRGDTAAVEGRIRRLERYRTRQAILEFAAAPLTLLRRQPKYALYVGAVVGIAYVVLRVGLAITAPNAVTGTLPPLSDPFMDLVRAVDGWIVEGLVLGIAVFTLFYEIRARYLAAVERALPEFLDDIAQRQGIGMALSESIVSLRDRDMGRLNEEIDRMARDFRLQSSAADVLRRFANRVRSPVVTRVVVLLTAAYDTADRLAPVVEALAERAELTRRLKRERQVEMSLYVVIIYISYLVFLVILVILNDVFLPKVPTSGTGGIGATARFDPVEYKTLFFHMSVIQGAFSGLVGGKMSEGTVSAGAKHALVMVLLAYVLFTLVLPNVAFTV